MLLHCCVLNSRFPNVALKSSYQSGYKKNNIRNENEVTIKLTWQIQWREEESSVTVSNNDKLSKLITLQLIINGYILLRSNQHYVCFWPPPAAVDNEDWTHKAAPAEGVWRSQLNSIQHVNSNGLLPELVKGVVRLTTPGAQTVIILMRAAKPLLLLPSCVVIASKECDRIYWDFFFQLFWGPVKSRWVKSLESQNEKINRQGLVWLCKILHTRPFKRKWQQDFCIYTGWKTWSWVILWVMTRVVSILAVEPAETSRLIDNAAWWRAVEDFNFFFWPLFTAFAHKYLYIVLLACPYSLR